MPVDLKTAREFVAAHHRHNEPPVGHKFSVGVAEADQLVGVAIIGRPVSRVIQSEGNTLEVIRTATDGTRNANSMLYGAARRAAFALGYDRLITYTQADESGASLRAAGFRVIAARPPRAGWDTPSRRRTNKADNTPRTLWDAVDPRSAERGTTTVRVHAHPLGEPCPPSCAHSSADSTDPCPEWNCPDLSAEDRREGKKCLDHPCTCSVDL